MPSPSPRRRQESARRVFTFPFILLLCTAAASLTMIDSVRRVLANRASEGGATVSSQKVSHNAQAVAAPSPFTSGNLVIYRVGTGTGALSSAATAVFLDEYTTGGTLVQSIAMPTATSGSNRKLTAAGTSAEGFLTRSVSANYVTLTGYDAAPGTASVSGTSSSSVNRVVGRVDLAGTVDTTTALTDAASGSNFRGSVSTDGTNLWVTGGAGGARYATLGATTSTQLATSPTNLRATNIFNNQLYVSASTGSFQGVCTVGSGTPMTSGQTITLLPGFPTTSGPSPYAFVFSDSNTLYVADDRATASGGGLQKWTFNGSTWSLVKTFTTGLTAGLRGLTMKLNGSAQPVFYATTADSATKLVTLTDTGAAGDSFTTLATAGANTAFRGVALGPVNTLSINDVSLTEGDSGTKTFTFTVSLSSPAPAGGVTFDIATADGTATTADSDYVSRSLTAQTIPAGSSSYSFDVTVNGDTNVEPNETFFVNVTNITGAVGGDTQGQGTIQNDDSPPTLSIADVTQNEGNAGTSTFSFTVSLSAPAKSGGVTFDIATADDTATAGSDYVARSLTSQTITEGNSSYTFDVTVNGDTLYEPNETFLVNVTNIAGSVTVGDSQAVGTITNDDAQPTLTINDVAQAEGNAGTSTMTFNVTLSNPSASAVTVNYATADSSATVADGDYVGASNTLTFNPGDTTKTIDVTINGDTNAEGNEQFFVNLSGASGATIADNQALGIILLDDPLGIAAVDTPVTQDFNVLAQSGLANTTPAAWTFSETGSNANSTYSADNGSSGTGNTYSYGSTNSSDRAFGTLQSGSLVSTVGAFYRNDTGATVDTLYVAYTGEQWRFGATGRADRLDFQYSTDATNLSTGTWTDVDGLDFSSPNTSAAVGALDGNAAGNRASVSRAITGLSIAPGSTFWIRWTDFNASGADDGLAIDDFSIIANPTTPALTVNDVTNSEGNAGTTTYAFTVSLSAPALPGGVTFDIATADGSATTADNDYVANSLTGQTIPAGQQTYTFNVTVNGDTTVEPDETFSVNVTNVNGANVSDGQGVGTILDDDRPLTPIYAIQGSGTTSPINGQVVSTTGIVTGKKSNGFYIQDPSGDGDPNTSDGVFVFTSSSQPAGAVVGNLVKVTGTVQEFVPSADPAQKPVTEIVSSPSVSVISTGNPLPAPAVITAQDTTSVNTFDNLERYEGMRVLVNSLTVVAPTGGTITESSATVSSNGEFFGVVTGVARPIREPGVNASDPLPPGSPANVPRFDENPERLRVDSNAQPGTSAVNVSAGTMLTNLIGELDFSFRAWTILPEQTIAGATNGGATPVPTPYSTEFTVASFNMERFFDTSNDPNTSDPVLSQAALDKRLNKASLIVRNVQHYPDVIGVEEMENLSTLQMVAAKINSDAQTIDGLPDPNYVAYLDEGNDIGGIDVGFLVKESRITTVDVTQVGKDTTFTNPDSSTSLLNDRPSLVLRATINRPSGGTLAFTVIVNHLRSLGSIDSTAAGSNGWATEGDRVRAKRKAQAEFLANYIQSRQTADPTEKIITVGDMNALRVNDGYVDMIDTILGTPVPDDQTVVPGDGADLVNPDQTDLLDTLPAAQQYSYTFDGNAQTLDHVIVNPNAYAILSRFAYARDDADQPVKDYEDGNIPDRISDHDQPVAYFNLVPEAQAGQFIISEFRFGMMSQQVQAFSDSPFKSSTTLTHLSTKGASSAAAVNPSNDEFIEFYNNTNAPLVVSTSDGSAGWSLVAADGVTRFTIPNGTLIPARGHFLATNSNGYSLDTYPAGNTVATSPTPVETTATGDITYTQDIPDQSGVALFRTANSNNFTLENRLDAVGAESVADPLYKESPGLASTSNTDSSQYSFVRDLRSGAPQDTNHNASDFFLVSTNNGQSFAVATVSGATVASANRLGAPGPENLSSPINRTDVIKASLVNPCVPSSSSPNRERVSPIGGYTDPGSPTGSGTGTYPLGYLDIRRSFTNTTNATVTRLRFRIVDITTSPSPLGTADLRLLTSPSVSVTDCSNNSHTAQGLTLEMVPEQSGGVVPFSSKIGGLTSQAITANPNGGGLNSTVSAGTITFNGGLSPTGKINVNFRLGVAQSGSFRFLIIIEALP